MTNANNKNNSYSKQQQQQQQQKQNKNKNQQTTTTASGGDQFDMCHSSLPSNSDYYWARALKYKLKYVFFTPNLVEAELPLSLE